MTIARSFNQSRYGCFGGTVRASRSGPETLEALSGTAETGASSGRAAATSVRMVCQSTFLAVERMFVQVLDMAEVAEVGLGREDRLAVIQEFDRTPRGAVALVQLHADGNVLPVVIAQRPVEFGDTDKRGDS